VSGSNPKIPPNILAKLEERGVDSVRALLTSMASGVSGSGRGATIPMDGEHVLRGHMEDWLRCKEAAATRRIKTGTAAAIAAAILAFLALVVGLLSWLFPIK
jgi:hypothetical protein